MRIIDYLPEHTIERLRAAGLLTVPVWRSAPKLESLEEIDRIMRQPARGQLGKLLSGAAE